MTTNDVSHGLRLGAMALGVSLALATSSLALPARAKPTAPPAPAAAKATGSATTTSARERARMAAVATPQLKWKTCYQSAKCAEVHHQHETVAYESRSRDRNRGAHAGKAMGVHRQ